RLFFNDGAILNNSGNYELQSGEIRNSSASVGTFNNSGTLKKTTTGTGAIRTAFNNTGTVNVESGTLNITGGGVSNGGNFNLTSGKTLGFGGGVYTLNNGAKINGSGNLSVSSGTLDVKLAGGTAIANTVQFTLGGGTFQVDGNWNLPTTNNWNGGTLKSSGIITNSGNLTLGGYDDKYLNTQLDNTGTIVQNDNRLFFNDGAILNNSGNYELQSGEIRNSSASVGTFNNSGTLKKTTTGTGTIRTAFNNTGTVETQSGTLNFTNTYTHNNANLILKGGTVTFSNALNINGGSIEGNASINVGVTNSGLLNPRYASNTEFGRLTINGNYTETNSASINIQLGGSTAGTNFDQVDINGTATFDGTLNVSLLNHFTPTLGSTFDVLTYDSLSFLSNLNFTGLDINSTLQFLPQWFDNKLTLKVVDKANATNITVTTNQDVVNASDSLLSLREAVIEANQNGLDNTIILGAQTYNLSFSGGSDDNFAAIGDLDILPRGGRLTIQGQGSNQTFISTSNLANLFEIHSGSTISFSNLTVINLLLDDNISVSKNVPLTVNILTNDDALKSQTIWLDSFQTTSVQGGTINRDNNGTPTDLSDDRLIYNPVAGFIGQDSFTYNITDGIVKEQAT
ncbi:MAG: beta strand repeat-containing protein, partial [Dolichospermum sp.]